jgi:hypothetical protein
MPAGVVARIGNWLVPPENPGGVVYGTIVIAAVLAVETGRHETYPEAIAATLLAAAPFWLAHAYATALGRRITRRESLTLASLGRALAYDWAIVRGAALPLLVLVVAWVLGLSLQTALTAAMWSAIAALIVFELIAGMRSQATGPETVLEVAVGVVMALAILALKIVTH